MKDATLIINVMRANPDIDNRFNEGIYKSAARATTKAKALIGDRVIFSSTSHRWISRNSRRVDFHGENG